jgi:hypothetical protein
MRYQLGVPMRALTFVVFFGVTACTTTTRAPFPRSDPPPLPSKPLPLSAFAVRFTPAGSQTYPPTKEVESQPYRIFLYLSPNSPQVRRDTKPTRPYVTVGTLRFSENWYAGENLDKLMEKHVSEVGGDAVLTWTNYTSAVMVLPGAGNFAYAAYELEVIRYTDR